MPAIAAAYATVAVAAAVLILGTYYRGGTEALRQNARQMGFLLLGAIVLATALAIATSAFVK